VGQVVHDQSTGESDVSSELTSQEAHSVDPIRSQGYWSDVDSYYTQPPKLLSIENVAGTAPELSHFFKLFFAAA